MPIIVVMERGYATRAGEQPAAPAPGRGFGGGAFEDVVLKDLIPLIDSTYRTITDSLRRIKSLKEHEIDDGLDNKAYYWLKRDQLRAEGK